MGASAGGITALNNFLDVMPPDSGLAFVMVLHLNPDFETHLHELLAAHTDMPVDLAGPEMRVEANHVYVIPPNYELTYSDGRLHLHERSEHLPEMLIDRFFHSLAHNYPARCVGVVLSGAGADGTLGLKAIRQAGGLTIVQDPNTTGYDSMPRSAIRAGAADEVLRIEKMVDRLRNYARYVSAHADEERATLDADLDEEYIAEVCEMLGQSVRHDFSQYKRPMLSRRISRRMMLVNARDPQAYLDVLESNPQEAKSLFKDLLISVTAFFRDPDAFEHIGGLIAKMLGKQGQDSLRIWVAGCASGEEAYSMAILAAEQIEQLERPVEIQIFATDIDERALDVARAGVYPDTIAEQVSRERLERFFVRDGDNYKVIKALRDMCIFSMHDLVSDPPFSRIDLLSCRNVLIYMDSDLQQKVVSLLHYALRAGGYLMLGPAENISHRDDLFRTIEASQRIFQAKELAANVAPVFPLFDQLSRGHSRYRFRPTRLELSAREMGGVFQRRLLDRFGPASALVDDSGRVLYFSGRLGRYLEHSSGPVEDNIVELARSELRLHLRTTLHKARSRGEEVVTGGLGVRIDDKLQLFDLVVSPLRTSREADPLWMVVFRETAAPQEMSTSVSSAETSSDDEVIEQLESELEATRDHLETTIAQLETANEELKSSNEELLSMNEELQSSNEEMQTSKEELQAVNQELATVNHKLRTKVEELDRAHADLQNLFESTRVPTVFLDRNLRIKRFTPAAREIFRLIDADIGRSLADITLRVSDVDLIAEVQRVLETLTPQELRVERDDENGPHRSYLLRVHPYRTLDDVIDGAVLTFLDVTDLERATERLRVREKQQACIAQLGVEALSSNSFDELATRVVDAVCDTLSTSLCALFSLEADKDYLLLKSGRGWPEQMLGHITVPIGHGSLAGYTLRVDGSVLTESFDAESRFQPSPFIVEQGLNSGLSCVVHTNEGPYGVLAVFSEQPGAFTEDDANFLVAVANVITSALTRKQRLEQLRASEARLRAMADAVPVLLWLSDPDRPYTWFNQRWLEFAGRPLAEEIDTGWTEGLHPDERERVLQLHRQAREQREAIKTEFRLLRADGDYRWVAERAQPWFSPEGEYMGVIGACIDITERREFEQALRRADELKDDFLAMLGHELRNPLAAITTAVDLLKILADDDTRLQQVRGILDRQSGQMKRLLDGLLDVTRIERGKMRLHREVLDLNELIDDVVNDWRSRVDQLDLQLDARLPPHPVWVTGDRTRLVQIFGNLLSNAVKFTDAPGRITVEMREDADEVVVVVRDTGVGIPSEVREHIFEPFRQAEQTIDRAAGGLGMGLPLVKGLVEAHGGSVAVRSEGSGEGAEFTVCLPTVAPPSTRPPARPITSDIRRILIVEDNRDSAELIETVLAHSGHTVQVCHDGESAVKAAVDFQPQAVLCDIGLPGEVDGLEVARRLRGRREFKDILLVAMTGYGSPTMKGRSNEAGFDAHLVKPVDLQTIEAVLAVGTRAEGVSQS